MPGDTFAVAAASDIVVNGIIVIRKGTLGKGRLEKSLGAFVADHVHVDAFEWSRETDHFDHWIHPNENLAPPRWLRVRLGETVQL